MPFESVVAFSTGLALATPGVREGAEPRVQYSAVTSTETRLPQGLRPATLIGSRTGSLLVGDLVAAHRSGVERTVETSLQYIRQVAGALPIDENDERVVDELLAKRAGRLATRPLRRRDGDPR
jgi:hypothetical protein